MDLIIKNGTVVTAEATYTADIGIRDGRIAQIGGDLPEAVRELDASGCYVMPGGIDVHTHLDSRSFGANSADDFRSGTIAAACGGTTSIIDFCAQERGQSLNEAIAVWDGKAQGRAAIDYGYHMIIADMTDSVFEELAELPERGITSFKLFMAYRDMLMIDDVALIRALAQAKAHGALVMVHAENGDAADYMRDKLVAEGKLAPRYHAESRPPRIEAEATARAIALAEVVGTPIYIVHVSCGEALEEVMRGKARGASVIAETCTQYLYLTADDLARPGFEGAKYVFTPPARSLKDHDILWRALKQGWLAAVSSDHCSWSYSNQKTLGRDDFRKIPNGAPGIEERMVMIYQGVASGRISLNQFVELTSAGPARIFGLPQKGKVVVGADADLVIWEPDTRWTIRQESMHNAMDYSCYEGFEVTGKPRTVVLRGNVVVQDAAYVGEPGEGRFLRREKCV